MCKSIFTIILLLSIAFYSFSQQKGLFKDNRDGRIYKTVKIGSQVWMAENLSTSQFTKGGYIRESKSKKEWLQASYRGEPTWCYYKFDSVYQRFGKLYNYYALIDSNNIAPPGWRVPSFFDYFSLIKNIDPYYSMDAVFEGKESIAGGYLRSPHNDSLIKNTCSCSESTLGFDIIKFGHFSPSVYSSDDWDGGDGSTGFWCLTDLVEIITEVEKNYQSVRAEKMNGLKEQINRAKGIVIKLGFTECKVGFDDDPFEYGWPLRLIQK
jgi:uncharacterized protein (TIGR02145 family)